MASKTGSDLHQQVDAAGSYASLRVCVEEPRLRGDDTVDIEFHPLTAHHPVDKDILYVFDGTFCVWQKVKKKKNVKQERTIREKQILIHSLRKQHNTPERLRHVPSDTLLPRWCYVEVLLLLVLHRFRVVRKPAVTTVMEAALMLAS